MANFVTQLPSLIPANSISSHSNNHANSKASTYTPSIYLPLRTDAVYLLLAKPVESVDSTNSESCREGWGNNDGDDIQRTKNGLLDLVVLSLEDRDGVDESSSSWREKEGRGGEQRIYK